jgi:pimeloyl-ACP methyl ester carboxylesterase
MVTVLEAALLAMDSYNRGGDGLNLGTQSIGNFSIGASSGVGGFFAQAYTNGGETVISYRGTDGYGDALTGWPQGLGFLTPQAQQAAAFYQQVNGNSISPNSNITLVGHSLGGGLAGFVASIYHYPS